jgi:hypothetical protein
MQDSEEERKERVRVKERQGAIDLFEWDRNFEAEQAARREERRVRREAEEAEEDRLWELEQDPGLGSSQ